MHPCLGIPEMILNIVEKADEIPRVSPYALSRISFENDDIATLRRDPVLSLAFVSKTFHEQAICVIWRELTLDGNIDPFVKCFKNDKIPTTRSCSDRNRNQSSSDVWDNLLSHTCKIRKLTLEGDFSNSMLQVLGDGIRELGDDAFRALTSIVWKGGSLHQMKHTSLFVSRSLQYAELERISSRDVGAFIQLLAGAGPLLQSLHIGPAQESGVHDNELTLFDSKFLHLQTLTSEMHLSPAALCGLGVSLPQLVELSCYILTSTEEWKPHGTAREPPFPALQRVYLSIQRVTPAFLGFVEGLVHSPIQTFMVEFQQTSISVDLPALFRQLAKFPRLSHLCISSSVDSWDHEQDTVDAVVLDLLALLPLITVDMSSVPFLIHDESIRLIGTTFPNVIGLKLGNAILRRPSLDRNTVTHDGLLDLVSLCPKLRCLGLPIDLNGLTKDDLRVPVTQQCNTLRRIEVLCERVRDPTTVAGVVSATFPNARFMPSGVPPNDPSVEVAVSWAEVNRLKDFFVLARQQTWAIRP